MAKSKKSHPERLSFKFVMSDGTEITMYSALTEKVRKLPEKDRKIIAQKCPLNHSAWTGEKMAAVDEGRVAQFRKRFGKL